MKRLVCLMMISATSFGAMAQDAITPEMIAARQEAKRDAEEHYKRMAADIEMLTANNQVLQDKVTALEAEIAKIRDEQAHAAAEAANSGVQDDLKHLAEKIQEVDKKREADKQVISDEIKKEIDKLGSTIKETAVAPRPRTAHKDKDAAPTTPLPDKGFSYTVQSGDYLSRIIKAYNAEFKSKGMKTITRQQVKAANPNLNCEKLLVGQKIIIPDPSSAN